MQPKSSIFTPDTDMHGHSKSPQDIVIVEDRKPQSLYIYVVTIYSEIFVITYYNVMHGPSRPYLWSLLTL